MSRLRDKLSRNTSIWTDSLEGQIKLFKTSSENYPYLQFDISIECLSSFQNIFIVKYLLAKCPGFKQIEHESAML